MALGQDKPGERYGFVSFIDDTKPFYITGGYEGNDGHNDADPEGEFTYEFRDGSWRWPIYTKKDQEYFLAKPDWFEVELPGGRPGSRPRPAKKNITTVDPPEPKEERPKPVEKPAEKPVSLKDKFK